MSIPSRGHALGRNPLPSHEFNPHAGPSRLSRPEGHNPRTSILVETRQSPSAAAVCRATSPFLGQSSGHPVRHPLPENPAIHSPARATPLFTSATPVYSPAVPVCTPAPSPFYDPVYSHPFSYSEPRQPVFHETVYVRPTDYVRPTETQTFYTPPPARTTHTKVIYKTDYQKPTVSVINNKSVSIIKKDYIKIGLISAGLVKLITSVALLILGGVLLKPIIFVVGGGLFVAGVTVMTIGLLHKNKQNF